MHALHDRQILVKFKGRLFDIIVIPEILKQMAAAVMAFFGRYCEETVALTI
jgi:hypothetical protein